MQIPLLPFVLGAVALTFALAVLGWWIASRVEQRRRAVRRATGTNRTSQQSRASRDDGRS